jgi:chromosome segregation ATPase
MSRPSTTASTSVPAALASPSAAIPASPSATRREVTSPGGTSGLKTKLASLERNMAAQDEIMDAQQRRISQLEIDKDRASSDAESQLVALHDKLRAEIASVKEDMEHRLALQLAENRRLQSHISSQKGDIAALQQRCVDLEAKVERLEKELGE